MSELDQLIIDFLKILADQTRLELLKFLKDGEKSSAEIQEKLNKSHSTISQHLKGLLERGVIIFNRKKVIIEILENGKRIYTPETPGELAKDVKFYRLKSQKIFDLLSKIQSFVIEINKEKLKDFGVLDTLL